MTEGTVMLVRYAQKPRASIADLAGRSSVCMKKAIGLLAD